MEEARKQLNNPLVVGIGSFVIGLIIGLVVLGWWLWPVQWYDASPANLRPDLQEDYLRMAIDSYTLKQDPVAAQARWFELSDPYNSQALQAVMAQPSPETPEEIAAYSTVVQAAPVVPGTPAPGAVTTPTTAPTGKGGLPGWLQIALLVMCLFTLLLGGALLAAFLLRGRRGGAPAPEATHGAPEEEGWPEYAPSAEEAPMAQFMATYHFGDDQFDDSFSVDSPAGEFLGECGVGISETIGVGDPKKVTAFEVWLFDKNDIQTVTKVLMSSHAFSDEAIRQRLEAKGEPIPAAPGTQVVLETAALQLVARVVDMSYGEGALPPESYFENLVLELAVWQK